MVSLDLSVIPALVIFLSLVFLLNFLLFRPILRIQAERARRTSGVMDTVHRSLIHQAELVKRYEESVRGAKMEGYRLLERGRAFAAQKRSEAVEQARAESERMVRDAKVSMELQLLEAKSQLDREAGEIAGGIAAAILQRTA